METAEKQAITVQTVVKAPVNEVWKKWTDPSHITGWCHASDDWHAPAATNDLRKGGKFSTTMAAKDGSVSFEFGGEYSLVDEHKAIEYKMADGRHVKVKFAENNGATSVVETFDPESQNSREMQQAGWQAILDNFKNYCEK